MREENVTKAIIDWLDDNNWVIVCYDFPQSGTGVLLRQNNENRASKNKGSVIPDIVAVKDGIALFFENKDRFYKPDFDKLNKIKTNGNYSKSLEELLFSYNIRTIYYGVGLPGLAKEIEKSKAHIEKVDFVISTTDDKGIVVQYDKHEIFTNDEKGTAQRDPLKGNG